MVDNQENILVELDYDNISLIDPNKVIDLEGNVSDRLVKQEDLVMYANLECNVLPRTKLAVGSSMNDSQRTISVGKINFLNPGNKTFFDTAWSDELTGKDTLQGKGVNQPTQTAVKNTNKSDDYYITQNLSSNGNPGAVDNGLLGITSISMKMGTDFLPVITVTMEDVKGRALFEGGNNSPYAAFFQLPYPQFTLTLKGYYGKAIKFPIMLQSFTSRFNSQSHNFEITLQFYAYKYTLLSYVNFGALMATPQMYNNSVTQTPVSKTQGTESSSSATATVPITVSRGYQKMKEVYSIYKSKGLIEDNFPEITLNQLKNRLQNFITEVLTQFEKENMGTLTDMTVYTNNLLNFQQVIFLYTNSSWYNTYMAKDYPLVLKDGTQNLYLFKNLPVPEKQSAEQKLVGLIQQYKDVLGQNSVFGVDGKYTTGGKTISSNIDVPISLKTFQVEDLTIEKIDLVKTYVAQKNAPKGDFKESDPVIVQFKQTLQEALKLNGYIAYRFEGKDSFMSITDDISKAASDTRKKIETEITASLATKFNGQGNGQLGFVPSIRNILAVFYCQGEAFLRLLDEVHKKAWDQRENPYRRAAIFGNVTTAPSVDIKTSTQNNEPIYPWPQVIRESVTEDNKEKFEIIYPGDQTVASSYRAYNPEVWPEVEFVEQFIKGFVQRQTPDNKDNTVFETNLQPQRISLNAIDFPVSNEVFQNKEESKYFYEIYERLMLNSFYSRFNRQSGYKYSIYEVEAEDEAINVLQSLGADNPFLSKKLKEYLLDSNNYVPFLKHISNQGQGESWQNYIRGEFVTPYIRGEVASPSGIFNSDIFGSLKSQPGVGLLTPKNLVNITNYLTGSSITNEFDIVDTYPLTNLDWDKKNLAYGSVLNDANLAFDTKLVLSYNGIHKTIMNFELGDDANTKRPFTYFTTTNFPTIPELTDIKSFYQTRQYKDQFATEGNLKYSNYSNYLTENQTTSMLNSPYFINAIQKGVFNFRYKQNDLYPYKSAAYLFLNSLPLATLREKYKSLNGQATTDLDYILATIKKFGGVHRLPYAWILKYGSIWHRYKIYKQTGVDMLDDVWTDFNYKKNWDPATSASTYSYNLTLDGTQRNLVLDTTTGTPPFTDINTGFYPQLIDDFNVFIQGLKLFSGQTQVSGSCTSVSLTGTCDTFQVTGTCSSTGTGITINSITNNFITLPSFIYVPQFNTNIQLVSQTSGTTGGVGNYTIPLNLNVSFSGLPFSLGTYANITNSTNVPTQVGQILSGGTPVSGITIQSVYSATTGSSICRVTTTSAQTFNYTVLNPPIQIDAISNNVLTTGSILNGPYLNGNVVISSQISGTTGGVGLYQTSTVQPPVISSFVVSGAFVQGIGSQQIQNLINTEKLVMFNTTNSTIFETAGFDTQSPTRSMRVSPWSLIVRSTTQPNDYFVLPSFGANVNQAKGEAFKNGTMKVELSNNPAMFNGTVRLYWNAPQYGWFDNSKLKKNNPETYLKQILNEQKEQQNFLIDGDINNYTSFEELFTTFNTEVLDSFETHFLNFSRSIYDYVDILPTSAVQGEEILDTGTMKNFQGLMRELFKITKPEGNSPETKLTNIISNQNTTFQQTLGSFLNYDVAFKFGNPSDFNRRLFYTFSTRYIEDPIRYQPYLQGSLPPQTTLSSSKQQNPESWKALEYYVGYSTIPQLKYSDNGSYLTDFFIDLNVQFNEKNVKDFAPLIKIYATQKLKSFALPTTQTNPQPQGPTNPIPAPNQTSVPTNPANEYPYTGATNGGSGGATLKQISTLTNGNKVYTYQGGPRAAAVIRDQSGNVVRQTTLASQTVDQARNEIIVAEYGSVSTNQNDPQFITNTVNVTPTYTTTTTTQSQAQQVFNQPVNVSQQNNGSNLTKFYKLMDYYIDSSTLYIGNALNTMLPAVRKELPNVFISEDGAPNRAPLEAGFTEQTRVELWETFKALNDTWIAGFDFESKTLFEDVLLVDRASRNVGDKVLVDIYGIIDLLQDGASDKNQGSTSYKNTLLDMVTTILTQNNFQHFMLPAYVNFYNVQDDQKNPTPRPDGTLEVGNMMFGTFLNVDYRQSSPKFLCYYVSKPSEHLNMKDNIDYRYRDDAFDLRRASDNPLVENQANKIDWGKSNKVVGFNVDITRENQQIFKSFSVSQDPGKPTSESLEVLNQMANLGRNRRSTTQSVSLYNLYKNRSYSCSVDMMGCALIQPMMYFNIRNVPMFSGPYMITSVRHEISDGNFETIFEGVRQPFYSLPTVDNFIQTLNTQILSQLKTKVQENETENKAKSENILLQASNIISNLDTTDTLTKNQNCADKLNSRYNGFTAVDIPTQTTVTPKDFLTILRNLMIESNYDMTGATSYQTAAAAFTFVFVDSGNANGSQIASYENNYSTIDLKEFYGDSLYQYVNRKYYCISRGTDTNIPVVSFRSIKDFIAFVLERVSRVPVYLVNDANDFPTDAEFPNNLAKQYVLHYPTNQNADVYTKIKEDPNQISKLNLEFQKAFNLFKTLWN